MPWNSDLAREYIDHLIEDMPTWANDTTEDVRRLQQISDLDLSHPALTRAFVRGACGFDLALDESMIFFYAICLGDPIVVDGLLVRDDLMRRSGYADGPTKAWHVAQDAFWTRPDIGELQRIAESRVEEI